MGKEGVLYMPNKINQLLAAIKLDQLGKMNKGLLISLLCLGIFLMLLPKLWSNEAQVPVREAALQGSQGNNGLSELQQEEQVLSQQAKEILGNIKGVGLIQVQVTLETGTGYEQQGAFSNQGQQQAMGPKIRGVVVAAQGAADPAIRWQLYQAVQALYDIPLNAIYIAEGMEEAR